MKMFKKTLCLALCALMLPTVLFTTGAQAVATEYVGYQITEADGDGNYSVRLVAALDAEDSELEEYQSVGFEVKLTYNSGAEKSGSFSRKSVYSSVFADGLELTPADMQLTGKYFFVLPITGLNLSDGDIKLEISTFSQKNGEEKITADAVNISVVGEAFAPDGEVIAHDKYLLADGAYEYAYSAVNSDEYSSVVNKILLAGYGAYSKNEIDGNLFGTYVKGDRQINVAYYPSYDGGSLKVVYSAKGYLPKTEASEYEKISKTSITQLGTKSSEEPAAGENYVIQLADGSFIIIDGGHWITEDVSALKEYLDSHKPASHDMPHITWMLTHGHSDHIQLARGFLDTYSQEISLDMICYNFPKLPIGWTERIEGNFVYDKYEAADVNDLEYGVNSRIQALYDMLDEKYPDTPQYNFHSGDVLYLADCKIEFLHTHEDFYPQTIDTLNKTGSVWKMSFKTNEGDDGYSGVSFLVLGDSEVGNCDFMSSVYGEVLDSDIVQAAHHGLNGGTSALYNEITPNAVFWPIDSGRGVSVSGTNNDVWDNNANHVWLNDNSISHYYADVMTTIYTRSLILDEEYDGLGDGEEENVWDLEA